MKMIMFPQAEPSPGCTFPQAASFPRLYLSRLYSPQAVPSLGCIFPQATLSPGCTFPQTTSFPRLHRLTGDAALYCFLHFQNSKFIQNQQFHIRLNYLARSLRTEL